MISFEKQRYEISGVVTESRSNSEIDINVPLSFTESIDEKRTRLLDRLLEFKNLSSNWDGYGAAPFETETLQSAFTFICLLEKASLIEFLSVENVTPNPNATVTMEWDGSGDYCVSIEIGRNYATYFALLPNKPPIMQDHYVITDKELDSAFLVALVELQKVSKWGNEGGFH